MWGEEPGEEKGGERYFDKCCACVNLDGGYSSGLMPVAGICFDWIRLFFSLPLALQEKKQKNQYLGAQHDRSIISELKWLSGIVIWWLLFAIVLLSPHFSPPLRPFTRFFPCLLSEFPWWHFMLQFENSRARDQVQENLSATNWWWWWTDSPSTFV